LSSGLPSSLIGVVEISARVANSALMLFLAVADGVQGFLLHNPLLQGTGRPATAEQQFQGQCKALPSCSCVLLKRRHALVSTASVLAAARHCQCSASSQPPAARAAGPALNTRVSSGAI